jgi:hypothetical protein
LTLSFFVGKTRLDGNAKSVKLLTGEMVASAANAKSNKNALKVAFLQASQALKGNFPSGWKTHKMETEGSMTTICHQTIH